MTAQARVYGRGESRPVDAGERRPLPCPITGKQARAGAAAGATDPSLSRAGERFDGYLASLLLCGSGFTVTLCILYAKSL